MQFLLRWRRLSPWFLQFSQRWEGNWSHDRAFRRLGTSLESGGQQLHGVADQRRRNHRGRKPPLANPFLTGARDAITSGEWKAQPGIALARVP